MDLKKLIKSQLPDEISDNQRADLAEKLASYAGKIQATSNQADLYNLLTVLQELEARKNVSGIHKWFQKDSPYSIDALPKHKAFFDGTRTHVENLFLGGNRSGKTTAGAYMSAVCATGDYPEWWTGVEFNGPISAWACGQTGQTTRDTVQEALLGPPGAWGTGMLPADSIGKITARPGVPGAVDTVQIKYKMGTGLSNIGFKSYDQKVASFFGTAKHIVWLDEPADDDVYNECLIRTMTTNGRIIHTITPKKGLTRLLADYLSDCDLLAGSESFEGLATAKALMDYEKKRGLDDE